MQMWWNDYVGIPYADKGRTRAGADCWGLVRLIYAEQFGVDLPSLTTDYDAHDAGRIADLIALEREGWSLTGDPQPGDVAVFRVFGQLAHVGVIAAPGTFLHAREGYAATIERLTSGSWAHRLDGVYKWQGRPQTGLVSVGAMPHPLRSERIDGRLPAGLSLHQINDEVRTRAGIPVDLPCRTVLFVDGVLIDEAEWDIVPQPGQRVDFRALPAGSGTARIFASLALVAFAFIVAPYIAPMIASGLGVKVATATAIAQTAIVAGGGLLLNAIFPVRTPPADKGAQAQNLLQGGANSENKYGAIPVVLGKYRYAPPLGGHSYAESNPTKSYLRSVFVWGYGPLQISDVRIGNTSINTLDEVEYATLSGTAGESQTAFTSLYGVDATQDYINLKLECPQGKFTSAVRASNVITVVTENDHGYTVGWQVDLVTLATDAIVASGTISTIVNSKSFKFSHAGANETLAAPGLTLASPWTERTITDESDKVRVELHFPQGLRKVQSTGDAAGNITAAKFRAIVQIRQLDSVTLAPITTWGNITGQIPAKTIALQTAFFNIDSDAALEPVYQWTRISVDAYGKIISRAGAYTTSPTADPTGTLLARLQAQAYGLNATFTRLPEIGAGEEELWRVCVYGGAVYGAPTDMRASSGLPVTGCNLTMSGLNAQVAAGSIARANSNTINLGADGEPYNKRRDAFTYVMSFDVPFGKHEVRIRRTSLSNNQVGQVGTDTDYWQNYHDAHLLAITAYRNAKPILPPKPLAMTAVRVKASNQINGNLDAVTATVVSICKDWDATSGTWKVQPTRNPASLFRYVLQHPANAQAVADAKIDLDALIEWHAYCKSNAFMFDTVLTSQRPLLEVLRDIAAAGRASPTMRDGKWSVVIDKPRATIAQFFTPHNSWGFESVKALPILPHGFRVQFANSERAYEPDEMIVYNDGYSSANATLFEGLTLPGVTTRAAVYKHARFHLAQMRLRPETYTINADIEHLICTRGDLVRVAHDVPMWGLGSGRVKDYVSSTVLVLDEPMAMDAGVQYTIRIRAEDGSSVTRTVAAKGVDGLYTSITLTTAVTATQAPIGGLFMFGALANETQELIVHAIEPGENMTARITLVDYSPDVYTSDSETLPAFDSNITLPPAIQQPAITAIPTISQVISNESVMLSASPRNYVYRIKAVYTNPASIPARVAFVEGQIKATGDAAQEWSSVNAARLTDGAVYFSDVQEGEQYGVRIRYADGIGNSGPWATVTGHTVIGRTTAPQTMAGASVSVTRAAAMLNLVVNGAPVPPPDLDSYEFRIGQVRAGATSGNDTPDAVFGGATDDFWDDPDCVIVRSPTPDVSVPLQQFATPRFSAAGIKYRVACRMRDDLGKYSPASALGSITVTSIS